MPKTNSTKIPSILLEAEVSSGLEEIASKEITTALDGKVDNIHIKLGAVQFTYRGNLNALQNLKTVIAVYILRYFDVPRPKALLGHQNFQLLLTDIQSVIRAFDAQQF